MDSAVKLRDEAIQARRIMDASEGRVVNPIVRKKLPKEYAPKLRAIIVTGIFERWNDGDRTDIYIGDVKDCPEVKATLQKWRDMGEWIWGNPGDLSHRRRVEEAADPKFWERSPPLLMTKQAFYRPNPFYLDPETKKAMREAVIPNQARKEPRLELQSAYRQVQERGSK